MKCTFILHQPLQLTYGTSCLVTSIETTDGNRVPCPACKEVLELSSIHSAPDAIVEILNNLPVMFERCKNMVKMQHLSQHTQSNCEKYIFTPSPTVHSIAATPLSTPVQQSELHAAGNILRRFQLHSSPEEGMLEVPSGNMGEGRHTYIHVYICTVYTCIYQNPLPSHFSH